MKNLRCIVFAALACAGLAHAEVVTVHMRVQIDSVSDPSNALAFALGPGDLLAGSYTYDTATPDSNPLSWVADYSHTGPDYGLALFGGGLRFASDPANSSFLVEIVDGYPSTGEDDYTLRSYNNLLLPGGVVVDDVSWSLYDLDGTVFASTALPVQPPDLSAYEQQFFSITGHDPSQLSGAFAVYGHVTWVSLPSVVTVQVAGSVQSVDDPQGLLAGQVTPGASLSASYTYDAAAKDASLLPTVGSYRSTQAPAGLKGTVGSLSFGSDRSRVALLLQVLNDHPDFPPDRYELRSTNNQPFAGNLVLDGVAWRLQDPTGQALAGTALPTTPPVLGSWQSPEGFTLLGHAPGQPGTFLIRAQVTAAQLTGTAKAGRTP